ncbi:MAG TPA: lipoyl(octanoyl) transferase LipB [Anaerolineales bacterium]|nr:lipoyl(octanoyl) transferase LipB [Anaerolineales bacterium]
MNGAILDLGTIEYEEAWKLQEQYAAEIAAGNRMPTLMLLEHPHVYTFGRGGHAENLLLNARQLQERGITVQWVDRGGDVTYHGPGQLVGYPLLPLGRPTLSDDGNATRLPQADYVGYVRKLEMVLIETLAHFGLAGGQIGGRTGVWIQADVASRCARCKPEDRKKPAKIASIGVKVDAQGISRHGFALNVNPDMTYWDGIIACGLADAALVSMADLLAEPPPMQAVKEQLAMAFADMFGWQLQAAAGAPRRQAR